VPNSGVRATSDALFNEWWRAAQPNCTLVSLEVPHLPEVIRMTLDTPGSTTDPQLLSFFRDPVDRCVSSWTYEAGLCLSHLRHNPLHVNYCNWWVRMYGDVSTMTQRAYANWFCKDQITNGLTQARVDRAHVVDYGQSSIGTASSGLLHSGEDCWVGCNYQEGRCTNFCGSQGACCRKSFTGNAESCRSGELGCFGRHCCVNAAQPAPVTHFFGIAEEYDASICERLSILPSFPLSHVHF
jgi:hypothetical protein